MSKLDELLAALSDDSPWSMKAAEVLNIPGGEIRDLLLEYYRRREKSIWFMPRSNPPTGYHVLINVSFDGQSIQAIGFYDIDGTWHRIVSHSDRVAEFVPLAAGEQLLRWRYLPDYPEGGE